MRIKCDICDGNTNVFLQLENIPPLQNRFFNTIEKAKKYQTTDVEYRYCITCDYIMINKNLTDQFDSNYNNSDTASPVMISRYRDVLHGVNTYCPDKREKIVEIGCGRGELLYMLQEDGYINLKGYDPAAPVNNGLIAQKYWTHTESNEIDCIIIRHTVEEIPDIKKFIKTIVKALNCDGKIYCEITNISALKNTSGIFSLYPEYYQLFSLLSLLNLFFSCGLSVINSESIDDGMRLGIWAKRDDLPFNDLNCGDNLNKLAESLEKYPRPIVLWGAAGRGGNILSFLKLSFVEFIVDINKEKQGKFIPPFGQRIISPKDLEWVKPKIILVANKKYILEVKALAPSYCTIIDINDLH